MVATAGSIAKLPSKNVARIAQAPHMSSMMLRVLFWNHREKILMVPTMRSRAKITNQATDLAVSPALPDEGCSSNHGKHSPAAAVSHMTEATTPLFPFEFTLETEKSWLESMLLVVVDGPAIETNQAREPEQDAPIVPVLADAGGAVASTSSSRCGTEG